MVVARKRQSRKMPPPKLGQSLPQDYSSSPPRVEQIVVEKLDPDREDAMNVAVLDDGTAITNDHY